MLLFVFGFARCLAVHSGCLSSAQTGIEHSRSVLLTETFRHLVIQSFLARNTRFE